MKSNFILPKRCIRLFMGIAFFVLSISLQAQTLSVNNLINNNAVLQRNTEANIWGKGQPGNVVSIEPQWGARVTTTISGNGTWSIKIPTPDTGGNGPFTLKISDNTKNISLSNIMLGEVWLCSGQSNMGIPLNVSGYANVINSEQEIRNSNFPNLRVLSVGTVASYEAQDEIKVRRNWTVSSPSTSGGFSAVAYFFGRDLLNGLGGNIPVGLIVAARGSTSAQPFTTVASLRSVPGFENITSDLATAKRQHEAGVASGTPFTGKFNIHNATVNPPPGFETPGALFNGMIAPITPFTLKGAVFYQGESNVPNGGAFYGNVFNALINSWRTEFKLPEMPFYHVQIAPLNGYNFRPGGLVEKSWEIREAHFLTGKKPNTGVAIILDSGEIDDIHPETKQVPGNRLALLALDNTYGQNIVSSGPIFSSASFRNGKGILSFDSIGSGLELRAGDARDDDRFGSLFEIAGANGEFQKATSVNIVGNQLEVSSPNVPNPTQARYAWKNWIFKPILYNKNGLPASSFRTNPTSTPSTGLASVTGLSGTYLIESNALNTQKLILESNGNVKMAESIGSNAQWEFVYNASDKTYTIQSKLNNRFLEVPYSVCRDRSNPTAPSGNSNNSNYNVGSWISANDKHQRWFVLKEGSDYVFIPSHCTENAMDRDNGTLNTNVHLWINNGNGTGGVNQKWRLVRPGGTTPVNDIPFGKNIGIQPIISSNISTTEKFDYVSARFNEASVLKSNKIAASTALMDIREWETFVVEDAGNGNVRLKVRNFGLGFRYLVVSGTTITATGISATAPEAQFKWITVGDASAKRFGLQSVATNKFVQVPQNLNGNLTLNVNGAARGPWELFTYTDTGVSSKNLNNKLNLNKIYPNPIHQGNNIFIDYKSENYDSGTVIIYALNGTEVFKQGFDRMLSRNVLGINTNKFESGVYILKIISKGTILKTEKIIIK